MAFEFTKKQILSRKDKSKKGSIDTRIAKLCDYINFLENYYTTSSCSGRVMLYAKKGQKKFDTEWLFVSHEPAKFASLKKAMPKKPNFPVWLRAEPMIIHICARTVDDGLLMLSVAREAGFKRAGIMSANHEKVMIEITATEIMDALVAVKGKVLASDEHLKLLLKEGNAKLKKNFEKIKKFEEQIKGRLMRL